MQRVRAHSQAVEEAAEGHGQGLAPRGGRQDRARHQERLQEQEEGSGAGHARQARVQA